MKKLYFCLIAMTILFVIAEATDVITTSGNKSSPPPEKQCFAMMSEWNDIRQTTIGSSNIVISTTYSNLLCKQIRNETDSAIVIVLSTVTQPDSADRKTLHLAAGENSGLLPTISKIYNTAAGSSASPITLYFHRY